MILPLPTSPLPPRPSLSAPPLALGILGLAPVPRCLILSAIMHLEWKQNTTKVVFHNYPLHLFSMFPLD